MSKLWMWLAWKLPRGLVYWCGVRIGAHATTGKWSHEITPNLGWSDAMERWAGRG